VNPWEEKKGKERSTRRTKGAAKCPPSRWGFGKGGGGFIGGKKTKVKHGVEPSTWTSNQKLRETYREVAGKKKKSVSRGEQNGPH